MRESTQTHVTLKINPSEEAALEDVLKFMYTHTLSTTSVPGLLNVLVLADRFEVASCVTYCSELLQKKPLSLEYALIYLELPSRLLALGDLVEQLKEVAMQYIVRVLRDFTKSEEEAMAMALPLCALEVVLGSDGLRVRREDELYIFIVRWARKHYPKLEERREILTKRLARFIYFPYLSIPFLEDIQANPEFDTEPVSNLILESLHLNAGFPYGQMQHIMSVKDDPTTTSPDFDLIQRVYELHPVKVVQLKSNINSRSEPRCIVVYLCLTAKDRENLFLSEQRYSQGFKLGRSGNAYD